VHGVSVVVDGEEDFAPAPLAEVKGDLREVGNR